MLFNLRQNKKGENGKKLKNKFDIKYGEKAVFFSGEFARNNYTAVELWAIARDSSSESRLGKIKPSNEFLFEVTYSDLEKLQQEVSTNIFDLYLKVATPKSSLKEKTWNRIKEKAEVINKNGIDIAFYLIRLGRFQQTEVEPYGPIHIQENVFQFYITKKGNISLTINEEPQSPTKIQIEKADRDKDKYMISGKLFTRNSAVNNGEAVLVKRETQEQHVVKLTLIHDFEGTRKKFGLNRYQYTVDVPLYKTTGAPLLNEGVYDLYLRLNIHDLSEEKWVRVGRPTFKTRLLTRGADTKSSNTASIISPYYTFKQSNLSFEVFELKNENYQYMKRLLKIARVLKWMNRGRDIWLVGERPYKAQDTGYHFFKYMRENHPDKEVYYVIEKDSPERKNIDHLGNVIEFGSKRHILYTLLANRIIGSHHPDYLYPVRSPKFKKKVTAVKVFLQHGVMGTKNMVANYGKNSPAFDTDLFLVSSEFEKEMIINDFRYEEEEVFVTGLSRFDKLFESDTPVKNQILIIPTWRDYIGSLENFTETEYYQRYHELIHHPDLHRIADENNLEVLFCLHPNMQKYSYAFEDSPVKVITQGEVDVQQLLKESKLMITDYSSVAFDFSFLHKPIVYYQFDRSRFIGKRPSHLDLDNDLPGDIVFEVDEVLDKLQQRINDGFKMKEEFKIRSDKFITHKDQSANERIYSVIERAKKNNKLRIIKENSYIWDELGKRFRKSKWYFPTMKAFYSVLRRFPVDKSLILFESGTGKQYADSPRYIYEEIVRKDLNYKKVWVYNRNHRFKDPNTKKIKRLSPKYYYYLATAGYWVNNQNFPTYMKKPKETVYLQTWHGTPLKKMLFDIEEIHGRSDDYLERVSNAIKNWDYLISPSEYATKSFRSAFRFQGTILETGYPRNDLFYKKERYQVAEQLKKQLGIPEGKKVVLYAPTFRDNQKSKNKFTFKLDLDLEQMQKELGEDFIILLRMHVIVSNKLVIPEEMQDFVIDVSKYPEVQELYTITDCLITDYSSVMFDYANTQKPMVFFAFDLDEYRDDLRGFYFDFEEKAPGPIVKTTSEVIEALSGLDQIKEDYKDKYQAFYDKFCYLEDGKATERVVKEVF
ncbi:CDP-glycerol glycerophosphotransferase family protein [Halobacillus sp. MO56]